MTTAGALVALPATLRLEAAPPDLIMVDFSTNDAYEEQDWANVSRGWYGADKKKLINPLKALSYSARLRGSPPPPFLRANTPHLKAAPRVAAATEALLRYLLEGRAAVMLVEGNCAPSRSDAVHT